MTWNLSAPCWMRYIQVLSTQPAAKRWGVKHSGSYKRSAWARTWRGRYSLCSHCIIPNSGTESELTLQDRLARVMQLCVWVKKEERGLAAPVSLTHTLHSSLVLRRVCWIDFGSCYFHFQRRLFHSLSHKLFNKCLLSAVSVPGMFSDSAVYTNQPPDVSEADEVSWDFKF